jgi:hypothetical protein
MEFVGLFFAQHKRFKELSVVYELADNVALIFKTQKRIVAKPPIEAIRRNKLLVNILFRPDEEFHLRTSGAIKSYLLDVHNFTGHVNDIPGVIDPVHWCWDPKTGGACCQSSEEAIEKSIRFTCALFISRGSPNVTISRFKGVDEAFSICILGQSKNQIFPRIVKWRRDTDTFGVTVDHRTIGFADHDYRIQGLGRLNMIATAHDKVTSKWKMPTTKICHEKVYFINRRVMGHKRQTLTMKQVIHKQ